METTTPAYPNDFHQLTTQLLTQPLTCTSLDTLQINLGKRCNQSCTHCHQQASPDRTETMTPSVIQAILSFLPKTPVTHVDLTGGAPELHPRLRPLITTLTTKGYHVTLRTNLTALLLPSSSGLPEFLKDHHVTIIASLPCYLQEHVDAQRGPGTYQQSIQMLTVLNRLGYGIDPSLPLGLVHNPGGPTLPAPQTDLERAYRQELHDQHGIQFTNLFTITNMPIGRFLNDLQAHHHDHTYHHLLRSSFNPQTIPGLMCQHQLAVRWDGRLYDCDFNLSRDIPISSSTTTIQTATLQTLIPRPITTADHCFGCTAGNGSSCQGALITP